MCANLPFPFVRSTCPCQMASISKTCQMSQTENIIFGMHYMMLMQWIQNFNGNDPAGRARDGRGKRERVGFRSKNWTQWQNGIKWELCKNSKLFFSSSFQTHQTWKLVFCFICSLDGLIPSPRCPPLCPRHKLLRVSAVAASRLRQAAKHTNYYIAMKWRWIIKTHTQQTASEEKTKIGKYDECRIAQRKRNNQQKCWENEKKRENRRTPSVHTAMAIIKKHTHPSHMNETKWNERNNEQKNRWHCVN